MPKAMVVVAHPDDETVALGARLRRFAKAHLVHVTDGAPWNERDCRAYGFDSLSSYREARAEELRCALSLAGLGAAGCECLEIPDQEASLHLVQLTRLIVRLLRRHRPAVVFTHPYEGGHPDHDACAFAVHHAVVLEKGYNERVPLIVEAAFYHAGPQGITTGTFLPFPQNTREAVFLLSSEERLRKEARLACFRTQQETLRYFPRDSERFRIAPQYDFRNPPHLQPVFYDHYPWGMQSQRFRELACQAEDVLKEESVVPCL